MKRGRSTAKADPLVRQPTREPVADTAVDPRDSMRAGEPTLWAHSESPNASIDNHPPDPQEVTLVTAEVGVYGWRKSFLYFSVLALAVLAIVNLGLIVWVHRVMDIHGDRAGPMQFQVCCC